MSQPFRQLSFNAHARQQQALVNLAKQFRPPPGMVTIPLKYPPPGGTGTQVPKTSYATKRCSNLRALLSP
ncbi:hypothetical protein APUTEX25_002840 [Auxenochlorella protothecoides]|uniref:Uncharacterized protein n=1 Tax=Auxenochlorella protothecoides TaxID=3075 RepID=A0A3M7L1W7_AUXPR|nr:hypothetical protein APUTEX25_002840 [Auxenochlorella protothecoides]|eukprot:RMZ56751.1 hypothetical protein APUTEX25_002840 [Auxenochlorella protothecoides]